MSIAINKFVLNFRVNNKLKYFFNSKNIDSLYDKGTATPDHVIRVKPFPLIIKPKKNSTVKDFETTAKNAFRKYRKKYIYRKIKGVL